MIVEAIFGWLLALATWLVAFLPVVDLDLSGLHALDQYTSWVGAIVDINALSLAATFIATTEAALWGYRTYCRIRGWLL